MHTSQLIPATHLIKLYVKFPHFEAPISCIAKVIWVKRVKSYEAYKMGIEFLNIEENVRQRIIDHLQFVKEHAEKKSA